MRSQWPKVWAIWLLPMKSFQLCDTKYSPQDLWLDLRDRKLRGKKMCLRKKAIHVYSKRISKSGLRKRQENWKQASFAIVSLNTCFQTQTHERGWPWQTLNWKWHYKLLRLAAWRISDKINQKLSILKASKCNEIEAGFCKEKELQFKQLALGSSFTSFWNFIYATEIVGCLTQILPPH